MYIELVKHLRNVGVLRAKHKDSRATMFASQFLINCKVNLPRIQGKSYASHK